MQRVPMPDVGAPGSHPEDATQPSAQRWFRHELGFDEPLARAIERICTGELSAALEALHGADRVEGVHAARKAVKRTRATLRLVRDRIGRETYRTENTVLREVGRLLSDVRSAYVIARTAENLAYGAPAPARTGFVDRLDERYRAIESVMLRDSSVDAAVSGAIADSRSRIVAWSLGDPRRGLRASIPDDFSSLARGIGRVYKRGRRSMAAAYDEPTTESFHRWRKRVRYLRYQVEALHLMLPATPDHLADELAFLADVLGEEHDLAELSALVAQEPQLLPDAHHQSAVHEAAAERRVSLRAQARSIGQRQYAERPKVFVENLDRHWAAWRNHRSP